MCVGSKAAANIEVEGTDVAATTIHALFEFDGDLKTKLDFTKRDNKKIIALIEMILLMLDKASNPQGLWKHCCCRRGAGGSAARGVVRVRL